MEIGGLRAQYPRQWGRPPAIYLTYWFILISFNIFLIFKTENLILNIFLIICVVNFYFHLHCKVKATFKLVSSTVQILIVCVLQISNYRYNTHILPFTHHQNSTKLCMILIVVLKHTIMPHN